MNNNEYVDVLNLKDESDLFCKIYNKIESSNVSISIISNADMINYIFRELISDNYEYIFEVGHINFENTNNGKNYILNIVEKNINIEPIDDNNSKLYKSSEIVFVDIDNVDLPILEQCLDDTKKVTMFGFDINFKKNDCECCDCEETTACKKSDISCDDDLYGFTVDSFNGNVYTSYSFHSTDKDLVEIVAKLSSK